MKTKEKHLIVRVTEEQFDKLVKKLDEQNKSRSEFLREMVEKYITDRNDTKRFIK